MRRFPRTIAAAIGQVSGKVPQAQLALPPVDLQGTAFQLQVWQALRAIPWGGAEL
jgi:O6-methylguanine-DNA--protein-cysteine methyltransferase